MTSLPPELIKILTTKSSKKESSKFTYKLNALINWIDNDTEKQNLVGLKYQPPNRLEIKKNSLAASFQVQIDSLMLNFRRNGFTIINKIDDWSIMEIPPSITFDDTQQNFETEEPPKSLNQPKKESKVRQASIIHPSSLQNTTGSLAPSLAPASSISSFISHLNLKWKIISDNKEVNILPIDLFLTRVSDIYQLKDLSQSDAFKLFSLVSFCSIPGWFSYENFLILASNFGEKNALLPKLIALLQSNQRTGNWIRFKFKYNPQPKKDTRVYFNPGISYGFIVVKPSGDKLLVYNDYNTPFFGDFLIDDKGNRYNSWDLIINS